MWKFRESVGRSFSGSSFGEVCLRCGVVFRKTHHESWTGLSSTKERFPLAQKYVKKYMLGKASPVDLLLSQYRDQWIQKKKKARAENSKPSVSEDKQKNESDGGGKTADEERKKRGQMNGVSRPHDLHSSEGNKEAHEDSAEDKGRRRSRMREGDDPHVERTEEVEEKENEEEIIETQFFKDSKNHKSLQLAIEIQDAIATHGLVPMVSKRERGRCTRMQIGRGTSLLGLAEASDQAFYSSHSQVCKSVQKSAS